MERILSIITLFLCLLSIGCPPKKKEEITLKMAMILQAESNPFFIEMEKGMRESALEHNIKLVAIIDEKYQADYAESLCLKLLDSGLNALIIIPESRERSKKYSIPLILEANRRKVPVILLHSGIDDEILKENNAIIQVLITSDKIRGGMLAGSYIAKKLDGRGRVLIMEGGDSPQYTDKWRLEGFLEVVNKYPRITIIYAPPGLWVRDRSFKSAVEALGKNPRIDAVYTYSEPMAYGILDAVDYTKTKKPIIVAFDGTEEGKKMIIKGNIDALIDQNPYEMGKIAIDYSLKLIKGEKFTSPIFTRTELITIESLTRPFKK